MMQKAKLEELNQSLFKWSKILGTEPDSIVEYILENIIREEETYPDRYATFCRDIGCPDNYKRFDQVISSSAELMDNLKTKSGTDYQYLYQLAELLDQMGEDNLHIIMLDHDCFLTDGEKFLFHPLVADSIIISDETMLNTAIQNKYMYKLPVSEKVISYDMIDKSLERFAFTFYLMELLFPKVPFKKVPLDIALDYAALWHQNFSPEYKSYIYKLLVSDKKNIEHTCVEILDNTLELLSQSIFSYRPYQRSEISVDYGDRRGRKKRSNTHSEDEYEVFRLNDTDRLFVMIADGVSTADLGRGEFISGKIREVILSREEQIKEKLSNLSLDDHDLFLSESRSLLSELVNEINDQATEKLNEVLALEGKKADNIESPMSSTILLGVVCGNWCSFAHLGDSEIILRKNGESNVINFPHNVHRERLLEVVNNNKPYKRNQEKDDSLTRVIPITYIENDCFSAYEDLSTELDFVSFALEEGEMVFLATDGLLSCLGSSSLRWKGLQELDRFVLEHEQLPLGELTKKLLDHADKSSVDDVAVVILNNRGALEEKSPPGSKETSNKTSIQAYPKQYRLN